MTWPDQQYPQQPYSPPQNPHGQYPQQQYPQPQYPQQPYQPEHQFPHQAQPAPGAPGQSAIAVTTKYLWLAWLLAFIKPKIFLNGHEVGAAWGRNVYPVQPGQYHVHAHVPYFLPSRIGPADLTVPVHPGHTVEIEYRAPVWAFARGALGPEPQKYHGAGILIGILVGLVALVCLCTLFSVVAQAAA
jgi:hypothetical protein